MPLLKVLALSKYDRQGASSRHRILNYIPYLQQRGVAVTSLPLLSDAYVQRRLRGGRTDLFDIAGSFARRLVALCRSRRFDLLWIEGELFPRLPATAERLLSLGGLPYVVDLDDAIFHTYDQHPRFLVRYLLGRKVDVVLRRAALVIAGNSYLADRARSAGAAHVVVIPTRVDERAYPLVDRDATQPLTFGWIGSTATSRYLATITAELEELCRTLPAQLRLIGLDQPPFNLSNVVTRPWSEATEAQELAYCDIGLAPLFDGPWERGKCGLKAIQYMAAGMPVVAANVGELSNIVSHGETGFLYRDATEFLTFARRLATDSDLRKRFSAAGRQRAAEHFSIHRAIEPLHKLLLQAAAK